MAIPILDLATLADRPTVAIDGIAYRLRSPDDFSILEHQRHVVQVQRFSELLNLPAPTDDEGAELAQLLDAYCRRVLEAPPDVQGKLTDGQRLRIVSVFAQLLGLSGLTPGATARPTATTGVTSSPGSPASTEATH